MTAGFMTGVVAKKSTQFNTHQQDSNQYPDLPNKPIGNNNNQEFKNKSEEENLNSGIQNQRDEDISSDINKKRISDKTEPESFQDTIKRDNQEMRSDKVVYKQDIQIDDAAIVLLRKHYLEIININIYNIHQLGEKENMILHMNNLLNSIREMEEACPYDPFTEIIMAFYDALVYNNNWVKYNNQQFKEVYDLFQRFNNRENITEKNIEKTIIKLEEIGFDTTPYDINISE